MFTNLNLEELLVLAVLAYAIFRASKLHDKSALIALCIGGYTVVNSATTSQEVFSGKDEQLSVSHVNFTEVMAWAGFGYGAYKLYQVGDYKGAGAAAASLLFTGFRSFKSDKEL